MQSKQERERSPFPVNLWKTLYGGKTAITHLESGLQTNQPTMKQETEIIDKMKIMEEHLRHGFVF